jgi:hypothetical protein
MCWRTRSGTVPVTTWRVIALRREMERVFTA